jgi:hypothetical protein
VISPWNILAGCANVRAMGGERVEQQLRIARSVSARYFGHLRLASNDKETDVLLGSESRSKAGLSVVDFRTAPLAEVFFGYGEGEDYGVEIEGRHLEGRLLQKNLITFNGAVRASFARGTTGVNCPSRRAPR